MNLVGYMTFLLETRSGVVVLCVYSFKQSEFSVYVDDKYVASFRIAPRSRKAEMSKKNQF